MLQILATADLPVRPMQKSQAQKEFLLKPAAIMPRNIEVKARLDPAHLPALLSKLIGMATHGPTQMAQDDTFFTCPNGRLKLRTFATGEGALIFYRRPDQAGPKESFFISAPIASPHALRETLALAYGEAGRVQKTRTQYTSGRTRVHIDDVASLGHFIELEVELGDAESLEEAEHEARTLMAALGIPGCDWVDGAYIDFLSQKTA